MNPIVIPIWALIAAVTCQAQPVDVGSRLQLLVDHHLIENLSGSARLQLHGPQSREIVMEFDQPWEGNTSAVWSIFRDGEIYRMYYRAENYASIGGKTTHPSFLCYAESEDGIQWHRPSLGLVEFEGSKQNNIISRQIFVPFKDTNPDAPADARYKAFRVATVLNPRRRLLFVHQSKDGIRWKQMHPEPVMTNGVTAHAFDTVNTAFWDVERCEYRAYIRDWKEGLRGIKTATSKDFLTWSDSQWLDYPGATQKELYTNMVRPYERNPELFIGFPTRYLRHRDSITEPLFMSSRNGQTFQLWEESIIRPGRNSDRWGNRCNYIWYGLIETPSDLPGNPMEYSIFSGEHYYMEGAVKLRRFTYRPDGFVSANAPWSGGGLLTKPLVFNGSRLEINFASAAAGSVRIEVQDLDGKPCPGFALKDCQQIFGDDLKRSVLWKGNSDIGALAGKPVRLNIALKDADLYAFRFRTQRTKP